MTMNHLFTGIIIEIDNELTGKWQDIIPVFSGLADLVLMGDGMMIQYHDYEPE